MKLSPSEQRMLKQLSENGNCAYWREIGGPGKTACKRLMKRGLVEWLEGKNATFEPDNLRIQITDSGKVSI